MQKRIDTRVVISDPAIIAQFAEYQQSLSDTVGVNLNTAGVIRSLVVIGLASINDTGVKKVLESVSKPTQA